jgi:hypothetical protein
MVSKRIHKIRVGSNITMWEDISHPRGVEAHQIQFHNQKGTPPSLRISKSSLVKSLLKVGTQSRSKPPIPRPTLGSVRPRLVELP